MDEIARKKAEKLGDNRIWTPLDCLEDTIDRIKDRDQGRVMLTVLWWEINEEGRRIWHFSNSNLIYPELIALIRISEHKFIGMAQ